MAVWIRLSDLPMECFRDDILKMILSQVGIPLKLDRTTEGMERGRFARVAVEVDLSKPLVALVQVHDWLQKVEFEGLHLICFDCGEVGHRSSACSKNKPRDVEGGGSDSGDTVTPQAGMEVDVEKSMTPTKLHGAWMIVKRKNRVRDGGNGNARMIQKQGNRNLDKGKQAEGGSRPQGSVTATPPPANGGSPQPGSAREGLPPRSRPPPTAMRKGRQSSQGPINGVPPPPRTPTVGRSSSTPSGKPPDVQPLSTANYFGCLQELEGLVDTPILVDEKSNTRNLSKGFAGGLTLFWRSSIFNFAVIRNTSQAIHGLVSGPHSNVRVSFAYVRPNRMAKERFWNDCLSYSSEFNAPWIMMGDFNDIADNQEQWGSSSVNPSRCLNFVESFSACGLLDMGTSGVSYSWFRQEGGRTVQRRKLDRALWNLEAQNLFPEAKAIILPRTHSDHHPLKFLCEAGNPPRRENRPFRFEGAWLTREDYRDIWGRVWSNSLLDVVGAISEVTNLSKKWNKETFGNIFGRKASLQARIKGVQESVFYNTSRGLQVLERKLVTELNEVLKQEELLWFQKSRRMWIQDGDRNTAFYHKSTLIRRNRSRIRMLKINGEWNSDFKTISDHISNFFIDLFGRKNIMDGSPNDMYCGPKLDTGQMHKLTREVTMCEVKKAVFDMKKFGSPGPDGIQAAFYQTFWEEVKSHITTFVKKVLRDGRVPPKILESFITLIPKKDSPETASDFRPITLLNVSFKIISKVIVNRMRPIMKNLIGPFQNSFLPGRSTADNIILTQEIVHYMRLKKGKKGLMAIKLDLHKAYDSIDWEFLESTLVDFGFPQNLISLIMFSVRESSISLLWNGEKLAPFQPGRGLRQGDPLAPYLFILAMERLSWDIQEKVRVKNWKPITLSRGGTGVSHLFFAEDLMLFAEASEDQGRMIMNCLKKFSGKSGLNINVSKSNIFCSPNTNSEIKRGLKNLTGISVSDNLGTYLGIPILHKRVSKHTFGYILDGMKRKLANWKGNMLSLAGRRTLVQSALSSMPVYTMQVFKLPAGTCNDIDRICRDFLWGDSAQNKKVHLVGWNDICKSKDAGGLGLRKCLDFNNALLAKLAWQLVTSHDKLWVKVMREKYVKNKNFFATPMIANASWGWRSIMRGRSIVELGAAWRIGNGLSLNFWSDWWTGDKPLAFMDEVTIPDSQSEAKVSDFILPNRTWNVDKLSSLLPHDIIDGIRATPIAVCEQVSDSLYWPRSPTGAFSVRSAFSHIAGNDEDAMDTSWVWKMRVTERCRLFLWLLMRGRLLTNMERWRKGMTEDTLCATCGDGDETMNHVLMECSFAKDCWRRTHHPVSFQYSLVTPLKSWVKNNCCASDWINGCPWGVTFIYTCWEIWKARNQRIFENTASAPMDIMRRANNLTLDTVEVFLNKKCVHVGKMRWVCWQPPETGWIKFNTDGAFKRNTGLASAGGLARDHKGEWLFGFMTNIGVSNSFAAELWGLREGLRLAYDRGLSKVIFELDSEPVVAVMCGDKIAEECSSSILKDCKILATSMIQVIFRHTLREGNKCADHLVNLGQNGDWGTTWLDIPPLSLNPLLAADAFGASAARVW
ncbi:PREDICTED: uncharacterized protein LOC109163410 [Ipomoea nil]|uniref:uncharacterized protein LOC109163410 n=1 Tax=Ipomoea nil TaxID=35883 RepID=UPI000901517F|nr:PREDICTED: uncharacterized protein LOC109163410 [Ipomoea nil]